jgi:hypothetical protein
LFLFLSCVLLPDSRSVKLTALVLWSLFFFFYHANLYLQLSPTFTLPPNKSDSDRSSANGEHQGDHTRGRPWGFTVRFHGEKLDYKTKTALSSSRLTGRNGRQKKGERSIGRGTGISTLSSHPPGARK